MKNIQPQTETKCVWRLSRLIDRWETDTQTDKQTNNRQTHRQQTNRQTDRQTNDRQTHRQQTNRQTDRQTNDRQTHRQQTNRQIDKCYLIYLECGYVEYCTCLPEETEEQTAWTGPAGVALPSEVCAPVEVPLRR